MNEALLGTVNGILSLALSSIGLYCLLSRRQVIKQLIGLTIMLQGALLIIVDAGRVQDQMQMAQGMVVSALVGEAIVLSIGLTLIINVYRYHPQGLVDDLDALKG